LGWRGEEGVYLYSEKKCVNKGYIGEGSIYCMRGGEKEIAWQGREEGRRMLHLGVYIGDKLQ
jgi:hypothetical protein